MKLNQISKLSSFCGIIVKPTVRLGLHIGLRWFIIYLVTVIVVACQPTLTPSSTAVQPSPTSTITVEPTARPTRTPQTLVEEPVVLNLWTIEAVSPLAPGRSGEFFSRMLRSFEYNHTGYKVADPVVKKMNGKSGVLNFLRTSKTVAPSILPDIAIMNATDLAQAEAEQLIIPLDNYFDREIIQDLLPVARKIGTVNDKLMGIPLGLDTQHIIYNTNILTNTELIWSDILTNTISYAFSAHGDNGLVDDATLSHYFSMGGKLNNDLISSQIDGPTLEQVLALYQQGIEIGSINVDMSLNKTDEQILLAYLANEINITNITVSQFLQNRQSFADNYGVASLPLKTFNDKAIPITHGWVIILVTDDPDRQAGAVKLMEWFLSTNNNANWSSLSHSIPTRDSAYQQLAGQSSYWQFLADLLNTAEPYPSFNGYNDIGRIMHQAVQQVMNGTASPSEATSTALDTLTN